MYIFSLNNFENGKTELKRLTNDYWCMNLYFVKTKHQWIEHEMLTSCMIILS